MARKKVRKAGGRAQAQRQAVQRQQAKRQQMQRQQMSGKQVERQQIERERAKRQQEGQRREQLLMQQRQEMQERQEMLRRQQMQMRGEPEQEGERRKKKARRFYDYDLLVVIIFLTAFGLIMIYSSSAYNAQVGGSAHSQHCYGTAADITVAGQTPEAVAAYARQIMPDWGGVGVYQTFTHVDIRENRADWKV